MTEHAYYPGHLVFIDGFVCRILDIDRAANHWWVARLAHGPLKADGTW